MELDPVSENEYRYFYDSLNALGTWVRTDDATYLLFKHLRSRDRGILNRILSRYQLGDGLRIDELKSHFIESGNRLPLPGDVLEQYQDVRVRGETISLGVRECASRYELIKPVFERFSRPFSVLDIGSNLGYFSIRIAEDFDATCVCIENIYSEWLRQILEANGDPSIFAMSHRVDLETLERLAECEQFDVVLGLSVLHHMDAAPAKIIDALRRLGSHVILELPTEDGACNFGHLDAARNLDLSAFTLLGHGESHLDGPHRPIVHVEGATPAIGRSYLATIKSSDPLEIDLTDASATIAKETGSRPFFPGLNAHTFLYLNGFYPSAARLGTMLSDACRPPNHADLTWWNVILTRHGARVIDGEGNPRETGFDDDVQLGLMKAIVRLAEHRPAYGFGRMHFVHGYEECSLLREEWHSPETHLTWTKGVSGVIAIPAHRASGPLVVKALIHIPESNNSDDERTVRLSVNGVDISSRTMAAASSEVIEGTASPEDWNLCVPAILKLSVNAAVRPADIDAALDPRVLGVGLSWIQLEPEQVGSPLCK